MSVLRADVPGAKTRANGRANGHRPPALEHGVDYEVVHRLPGRIRIRIDGVRNAPAYAQAFERALSEQSGITTARANT
jgi:hypothetical protein